MRKRIGTFFYPAVIFIAIIALYIPTLVHGLVPVPSDTIIGLYHPFRDLFATEYPNGIPYKNFLITDPVRQIIPWKMLVIDSWKAFELPLWNPYEMTGKPLLANFQSGALYPLNILLFTPKFITGWTVFIIAQQILAGFFFYLYTQNLKLQRSASAIGTLAFTFSGFFIAWLQWGNIVHTVLWLPLILLAIDKISSQFTVVGSQLKNKNKKISYTLHPIPYPLIIWSIILVLSLSFSLFAGHVQTHFYVVVLSLVYLLARLLYNKKWKHLILYLIPYALYLILTAIQWIPGLQFISLSARQADQVYTQQEGWFIPFHHLIQFVAPDFFGNPATLNYWGTWNYGEMVGYVGIVPLVFALFAVIAVKRKVIVFFAVALITSLIFAVHNPIAEVPFMLNIPFISSSQPTRLLFIAVFALSVLASFGFDHLFRNAEKSRKTVLQLSGVFLILSCTLVLLWSMAALQVQWLGDVTSENWAVAKRNLVVPTALFAGMVVSAIVALVCIKSRIKYVIPVIFVVITVFDLLRFSHKFLPFTPQDYLFPPTQTTTFLDEQPEPKRVLSLNNEVMPPNFLTAYRTASVDGYDPLYTLWYARFVTMLDRSMVTDDIVPFNRIVTPRNLESNLMPLLNAEYILATQQTSVPVELEQVFEEGQTVVYKNSVALPRVFFVPTVHVYTSENRQLSGLLDHDLSVEAIIETEVENTEFATGSASIIRYDMNKVEIATTNEGEGFLVFTDAFYPTWKAYIDTQQTEIYRTNFAFRGVIVPAGEHTVVFKNSLFGF